MENKSYVVDENFSKMYKGNEAPFKMENLRYLSKESYTESRKIAESGDAELRDSTGTLNFSKKEFAPWELQEPTEADADPKVDSKEENTDETRVRRSTRKTVDEGQHRRKTTDATRSDISTSSYNPFEHRHVRKPTSDFGSLAHLLKTSLGSGILAMAMAYKNSGLVFGAFGTVIIGIICTHCVVMLVRSSQILCVRTRVPTLSFARTAEVAFEMGPEKARKMAKTAKTLITTELLLSFILGNTVYVVFMSESIYQVIEFYFKPGIDIRVYVAALWIPLILMCMLRTLKSLVPFSIIANIFVIVSFGITLYYIFRDIHETESVYLVAPFERWPMFLTTVIFAIEGIGTVLPIEHEMRHPEHFLGGRCGIIYISMAIVIIVYGIIGFFGYLQYGENTKGSITLNLPVNDTEAQIVKILIALAIFFTFALQFYVPINILWDMMKDKIQEEHHIYYNTALRAGLVTLTIIASIAIPNLEPVIGLVGAICFSMLGLFLPALIDTLTRYPSFGVLKWRLVKNILIIILSLIALTSGTYSSILNIVKTYTSEAKNSTK